MAINIPELRKSTANNISERPRPIEPDNTNRYMCDLLSAIKTDVEPIKNKLER